MLVAPDLKPRKHANFYQQLATELVAGANEPELVADRLACACANMSFLSDWAAAA